VLYVDIGSSGDINPSFIDAFAGSKFIACDPLDELIIESQKGISRSGGALDFIGKTLVWNKKDTLPFYVCQKREVSSVLKPNEQFISKFLNPERFNIVDTLEYQADKLDNLLNDRIDYLKIDVQGASFEVLEGAKKHLQDSAPMLEVELEFEQVYKNQKLIEDTTKMLRKYDYNILNIQLHHWATKPRYYKNNNVGSILVWAQVFFGVPLRTLEAKSVDIEVRKKLAKVLKFDSYEDDLNS
jgi:FkbM family methyltransferase